MFCQKYTFHFTSNIYLFQTTRLDFLFFTSNLKIFVNLANVKVTLINKKEKGELIKLLGQ